MSCVRVLNALCAPEGSFDFSAFCKLVRSVLSVLLLLKSLVNGFVPVLLCRSFSKLVKAVCAEVRFPDWMLPPMPLKSLNNWLKPSVEEA